MQPLQSITDRIARIHGLRLLLWVLVAAWFLQVPLAKVHNVGSHRDWTYIIHHYDTGRKTIVEHGQFPAWDPYYCGGIPASGNIANSSFSLSMLLVVLFGLMPGLKLALFFFFVFGLEGMYRYARHKGIPGAGAIAAALLFAFSGRFAQFLNDGEFQFVGMQFMPWILLCFEKGFRSRPWWLLGGFVLAGLFCEGGAVTTPLVAVLLLAATVYHCAAGLWERSHDLKWYRPALVLFWMGLLSLGLSAVRLFPVAETLTRFARVWHQPESYNAAHILGMLFQPATHGGYAGIGTAYIGIPALIALVYAVISRERRTTEILIFALFFLALATGDNGLLGIYDVLKKLPLFKNLRRPFRYVYVLTFIFATGAGLGLAVFEDHLLRLFRRFQVSATHFAPWRGSRLAYAMLAMIVTVGACGYLGFRVSADALQHNQKRVPAFSFHAPRRYAQPFRQSIGNRWNAHVWPAINLGSISCFEEQPFYTSPALRADLPQEEYLSDPTAGTVTRRRWSPNRIELDVTLVRSTLLLVNQNRHRGWVTNVGSIVQHEGLVAVLLPAGKHRVVLRFSDTLVNLGLAVTLFSGMLLLGLLGLDGQVISRSRSAIAGLRRRFGS